MPTQDDRLNATIQRGQLHRVGPALRSWDVKNDSQIKPEAGPQSESVQLQLADQEINNKWSSLGGAPGAPWNSGLAGLLRYGPGFFRQYANGTIYYRPGQPPFYVYGSIGVRYLELRGLESWLGWPTSDELPFSEGGRVTTFDHGAIYWWPDTGAMELNNVAVKYTGLVCFGETDVDQDVGGVLGGSDEPYVIFGVIPAPPGQASSSMTNVYQNVDGGESVRDDIELYRGLPYGMSLSVLLMEQDFGDPNKFRKVVEVAVENGSKAVAAGLTAIPVLGPGLAMAAAELLREYGPQIVEAVNDALDTDDDHLGTATYDISAKAMVTLTRAALKDTKGIPYHLESPLFAAGGASYKVYAAVYAV